MNTPAFMQVGRVDAVVHALNTPYALDDAKLVQLVGKVQHTPIDLAVAQALSKLE